MSKVTVTFSGAVDIANALMTEMAANDVTPAVNSVITEMKQFILENGDYRYTFVYETGDTEPFLVEIGNFITKQYPSIRLESLSLVEEAPVEPVKVVTE